MARDDNNQSPHPEQHSDGLLNDPHSRRRFLRAAVVGTAGVAGAAGVAGVALARNSKAPSILSPVLVAQQTTETPIFTAAFEDTMLTGSCTTTYGGAGNSGNERYFLFLGQNLPGGSGSAGDYTFELTQQLNANSPGEIQAFGAVTAFLPWDYADPGNPIHVDVAAAGTISSACASGGSAVGTAFSAPSSPPPIVSFHLSATSDVLIYVHIVNNGSTTTGDTTTFTGTLTGPVSHTVAITVTAV